VSVQRSSPAWYVAATHPHNEQVAAYHLERQGFTTFLPCFEKVRRHARKVDTVLASLFAGYIFVSFDVDAQPLHSIRSTFGVCHLVGPNASHPQTVPRDVIDMLQARSDQGLINKNLNHLRPGDEVRLINGPFAEHIARVEPVPGFSCAAPVICECKTCWNRFLLSSSPWATLLLENARMKKIALPLLALSLLAGCAGSGQLGGASNVTVLQGSELPVPDRSDLLGESRPYLIGPFDKLMIDVFGIEELSKKEVQTDASGRISFPLAGIIEAAGKTPAEVEEEIEARLRSRYVRDPQVTVNLKETVSQVITVDGQVKRPGLYPVIGKMTLMRAVATAEGTVEFAKLDDVVIFRTVKGQQLAALYDLRAIRRGNYVDPEVFANDVIVVGDSQARRLFRDALAVTPVLMTPIILLLQNNNM
jgi:polysaccharide export outer membrane protein